MKSEVRAATTVTVHVPMAFAVRGGRREIISNASQMSTISSPKSSNALLKALARAHRWRCLIETGQYASITELARAENVNQSYACRLLRLTLLGPAAVVEILNGNYASDFALKQLMKPFPVEWDEQLIAFKLNRGI
jgi:hypothetical protein